MYASRTGTRRNLAALRDAGWRLLVSARGVWRTEGFRYAIDNGAWTSHQNDEPFDVSAFVGVVDLLGCGADWIALPDIVGGGLRSLDFSLQWIDRIPGRRLIPVQDGMKSGDVRPFLSEAVGIFLGGTTDWKLQTMREWGRLSRSTGCHFHVGRVNSRRRIRMCIEAGAHSCDGTAASRYAVELPKLAAESKQQGFVW